MGAVTAGGVCAGVVDDPMTIAACASKESSIFTDPEL